MNMPLPFIATTLTLLLLVPCASAQDETSAMETRVIENLPDWFLAMTQEEQEKQFSLHEIVFGAGSKIVIWRAERSIFAKNTPEQLDLLEALVGKGSGEAPTDLHILIEYIEVEHLDFIDWVLENPIESNATPLRMEIQDWIRRGKAREIGATALAARSGQRARVESVSHYIYPSEMDPPELPNELVIEKGAEVPITPTSFTAFESRNLGTTFEVDPVIGADGITVDLNLAPERVDHVDDTYWPSDEIEEFFQIRMPTMATQRITTQITTLTGQYLLLGTHHPDESVESKREEPYILVFIRADIAEN